MKMTAAPPVPARSLKDGRIELHVRTLAQLYNSMDPSPFHERDLDPHAEQFILDWAQELRSDVPIKLSIYVDIPPSDPDHLQIVRNAFRTHFQRLSDSYRRQLRRLFKDGRTSLIIGLSCLAASVLCGELIVRAMSEGPPALVIRESLLIGGWVAMWRPIEIFLYEWWPIRNHRRVLDRLAAAEVSVIQNAPAS